MLIFSKNDPWKVTLPEILVALRTAYGTPRLAATNAELLASLSSRWQRNCLYTYPNFPGTSCAIGVALPKDRNLPEDSIVFLCERGIVVAPKKPTDDVNEIQRIQRKHDNLVNLIIRSTAPDPVTPVTFATAHPINPDFETETRVFDALINTLLEEHNMPPLPAFDWNAHLATVKALTRPGKWE